MKKKNNNPQLTSNLTVQSFASKIRSKTRMFASALLLDAVVGVLARVIRQGT